MLEHIRSYEQLVKEAISDQENYVKTIAGLEESPAMIGYAEFGVPWHSASCQTEDGLAKIKDYKKHVEASEGSAWMDNTTIVTATTLLSDEGEKCLTPLTIWDLATFARAVIFYDNIYHHEHPNIKDDQLNTMLEDQVVKSVPLPFEYTGNILPNPWNGAHRFMCDTWSNGEYWLKCMHQSIGKGNLYDQMLSSVTKGWRYVLGNVHLKPFDLVNYVEVDKRWRSPSNQLLVDSANITDVSENYLYLDPTESILNLRRRQIEAGMTDFTPQRRSEVLSDLNLRSYINQRLAEFFGLPYACSLARQPFRKYLFDQAVKIQQESTVARVIENRYKELASGVQLRLPVFLALALRESIIPSDIWRVLAQLRVEAKNFRAHRVEMDKALARGDLKEAKEISKALQTTVKSLLEQAGDTVNAVSGKVVDDLTKGDISVVKTAIGATAAAVKGVLKSSFTDRFLWRIRAPHILWTNNIVDQSKRLTEALPELSRLWGIPPNTQPLFAQRFEKLRILDA